MPRGEIGAQPAYTEAIHPGKRQACRYTEELSMDHERAVGRVDRGEILDPRREEPDSDLLGYAEPGVERQRGGGPRI